PPHEFTIALAQGHHRIRPLVVALSEAPEIMFPKLRASLRIQCDHVIVWSAQKEFSVSEDGRSLKRSFLVEFLIMRQCAGAIGPRGFELCNICAVDLRCQGVARAAAIVAVVGPARVGPSL